MSEVRVVSGSGPYADAWHPFAATSARLAEVIAGLGHRVMITEDVEPTLERPGDCDLLVINIGNPAEPRPAEVMAACAAGLQGHLAAGGALLGVHVSATSLVTMAEWPGILGGQWVRGRTMHPPQDAAVITVRPETHPLTAGLADFEVFDERYCYLCTEPDVDVVCDHEFEDVRHPLVWARESGRGRVVYDALGHDARSYDSPGHLALLQRSVRWLLHDL